MCLFCEHHFCGICPKSTIYNLNLNMKRCQTNWHLMEIVFKITCLYSSKMSHQKKVKIINNTQKSSNHFSLKVTKDIKTEYSMILECVLNQGKNKYKRYYWDSWCNLNIDYWDNNIVSKFLILIIVLWLHKKMGRGIKKGAKHLQLVTGWKIRIYICIYRHIYIEREKKRV